jgi:2-dehydro-3-deoxyphosphogluconate aldolase/(4S)-4-hydroxy-2-oxoglutarate aldolase
LLIKGGLGKERAVEDVTARLWDLRVVPVSSIPSVDVVPELGTALLQGGLPVVEVTFRTSAAAAAVREFSRRFPELLLGAGTVLTAQQAEAAVGAGAEFIVSPGFGPDVVTWCLKRGVPVIPGVATPTEIQRALDFGLRLLKFFPAEVLGGTRALRAFSGPFKEVRFMPTGGISAGNLAEYLSLPNVQCCGGSWLTPQRALSAGDFEVIKARVFETAALVRSLREGGE